MDISKKRKADENGIISPSNDAVPQTPTPLLTPQDARKIIDPFTKDQLLDILQNAVVQDSGVLTAVRLIADADPAQRKLFVRGLGWETNTDKLRQIFSSFGQLDDAIVITDKATGKSKGYGFVTFKHIDGAILALKEPNKKIDGRITVAQLASLGNTGNTPAVDVSMRKIYVGNVPFEISSERLLVHFSAYGEIEEGPLGFDKQTGKAKGFAFFVYRTEEGARASLVDPVKNIDGHQVLCKYATDGKKGKPPGVGGAPITSDYPQNTNYGVSNYGMPMPSSIGSGGYGNQVPATFGGGYGSGYGVGVGGGSQYGGGGSEYGRMSNSGSSMYGLPPSSVGMPSGGYPEAGSYGLSSASGYPSQLHQPSSGPRVPPGGMYLGMPPYY